MPLVFGFPWIQMSDRSKGWTLFCFLKGSKTFNLLFCVFLMFSVCSALLVLFSIFRMFSVCSALFVLFRTQVRIFARSPVTNRFYEMNILVMSGESKTTLNPFPFHSIPSSENKVFAAANSRSTN